MTAQFLNTDSSQEQETTIIVTCAKSEDKSTSTVAPTVVHHAPQERNKTSSIMCNLVALPSLYSECDDTEHVVDDGDDDDDSSIASSASSFVSAEEEMEDDLYSSALNNVSNNGRRVTWSNEVVTQTHYRPMTTIQDKPNLHYSGDEMTRFRQEYKMQIKAAQKLKRERAREQKEEEQRSASYKNPFTSVVNTMTEYLSSLSESSHSKPTNVQLPGNSVSRRSLETNLLIDTLYLF